MRKTLASLAFTATTMFGSCSTTVLENKDLIYGNRIGSVTNKTAPYNIETTILRNLGELAVYVDKRQKPENSQELPFILVPYNGSLIVKDRKEGKFDIESREVYIPTVSKRNDGNPHEEMVFTDLKARVTSHVKNGTFITNRTQKDLSYEIPTIEIDTDNNSKTPLEEFYIPHNSAGALYFIRVGDAREAVNTETGEVTLKVDLQDNKGRIYVLNQVSIEDYKKRPPIVKKETPSKEVKTEKSVEEDKNSSGKAEAK